MSSFTVIHQDADLQIATWSRIIINRWKASAKVEQLDILLEQMLALIDASSDRRIAVLTTIQDRSGLMPSSDARKKAEQIARTTREAQILQAQVVEGEGFVSATMRAVLTGVTLAIRAPYPTKVFKSEAAALPWVSEKLREAGYEQDAAEVASAVQGLHWG